MRTIKQIFFCILLLFSMNGIVNAEELTIHSKHAILYNLNDNTILYEKDAEQKTAVASLTKIMTTIVAIEKIDDFYQTVTITSNVLKGLAEANASVAGFQIGDTVNYFDLLMGTMLPSGADAARGLAINLAGSEEQFVVWMNQKAQELQLANTQFINTTGLDVEGHYSTVKDIATILKYALKNPIFYKIYTTKEYTTTNGITLYSTLKKLSTQTTFDLSHILGTKTGYTGDAGLCLSSIAHYDNIDYLLVTTGADSTTGSPLQLLDAINLYHYYSSNYSYQDIITSGQILQNIPIQYNYHTHYTVTSPTTISLYLPNTFQKEKLIYKYHGTNSLSYQNKFQERIGNIEIIYEDKVLDTITVYLEEDISFNLIPFLFQTKLIYIIVILFGIFFYFLYRHFSKKKQRKL